MVYGVPEAHGCPMSTTPPEIQPPPTPGPDSGPRVGWDDIRDLGRIRRTTSDRRVAGVAGGLARHLDIDPLIVRVAFVVLTFFGGAGLLLYIACWLLVPEEGSDWGRVALDRRSRTVALVLVGALVLVILAGHTWWGSGYPWALLIVAGIVALVATQLPRRDRRTPAADGSAPATGAVPGDTGSGTDAQGDGRTQTYAAPPVYVEQPRPVNPRKKGPILFWFALAVMAVGLGVLGVVDLAGASVAPSAYPALVLALSGVFLLVGAFWGRAGGLILIGLVAALVTAGVTIGDQWDPHRTTVAPASAAQVQSSYSIDVGELVVDLSEVSDPQGLDGREIEVRGNVGHLDIRVPDDVTVVANTHVTGVGGINAFDRDGGGIDTELTTIHSGGPGAPRLTIDAELHVGGIDVQTEPTTRRSLS
jgi:phage shock protein PspC (stress-responsive transcriptional regulator)